MVIGPGSFPTAGAPPFALSYYFMGSPLCSSKALTYAVNAFFWCICSSFPIHAQEAYIHKTLLDGCHYCPTTNLTVAECLVAVDVINVYSALSIDFKAGFLFKLGTLSEGARARLKERILKASDNLTSSSHNLSFPDKFFPCGSFLLPSPISFPLSHDVKAFNGPEETIWISGSQ